MRSTIRSYLSERFRLICWIRPEIGGSFMVICVEFVWFFAGLERVFCFEIRI